MRIFAASILTLMLLAAWTSGQDAPAAPADEVVEPAVTPEPEPPVTPEVEPTVEDRTPKGPPLILGAAAKIKCDVAVREQRPGVTVIQLTGRVELTRGGSRLDADRAVVFIDEVRSAEIKSIVTDIYAEGNVVTTEEGLRTKSPQAYFRWGSSDFTVDDVDGFIAPAAGPLEGDLMTRAQAARTAGTLPPGVLTVPPKGVAPVGILVEPSRLGLIYGQQQEGPDIKSHTEGDWRVTVLTRYPDIVLKDPTNPTGEMEILAENMVIWVNETKVRAGGKLQEAELQVYAEGNVVIYQGQTTIECEQMYYDFKSERGLLIGGPAGNTSIRAWSELRRMPFYFRAKEFRQVASDQYQAKDGILTTCEFPRPDWGIRSRKMTITVGKEAVADEQGETIERPIERAEAVDTRLVLDGVPVFYWPYFTHDLKNDRTALKDIQFLSSTQFGFSVLTQWDLYDLGLGENDWSEATLLADVYSKRGLGLGLDFKYRLPERGGDFFLYGISDSGIDLNGLPPPDAQRERVRWRHRRQLSEHWRLDVEFSWISDSQFLREFWEQEFKQEKEQESYLYLRYLRDNRTFTALARVRLNDFQTQTEYLPEFRYAVIGQPLGPFTWITDTRLSNLKRNFRDDLQKLGTLPPDYRSWRFVTEHELQLPLKLGIFRVAPFVNVVGAFYENVIADGRTQTAIEAGLRASTQYWRIYDVYSRLLDVNRLRHVVTPTVEVFSVVSTSKRPGDLFQFDGFDALDQGSVVRLGLRQRWQTRRLARTVQPATVGGWYNVNWMILDLEINHYTQAPAQFNDPDRNWGPLEAQYTWQLTDRVAVIAKADVRVDREPGLETFDFGFVLDRSPKASFYIGDSYIAASKSNILTVSASYKIDERWTLGLLTQYDVSIGRASNYRLTLQRRLHCWIMEIGAENDVGQNNRIYTIMFWPVGIPEAKLRFF